MSSKQSSLTSSTSFSSFRSSSAAEELLFYSVPGAFLFLCVVVCVPWLMAEPYGRSLVGVQIDNGSKLISMAAPMFGRLILTFGGIGVAIYLGVRGIMSTRVYKELLAGRLWPAGIKPRLA